MSLLIAGYTSRLSRSTIWGRGVVYKGDGVRGVDVGRGGGRGMGED